MSPFHTAAGRPARGGMTLVELLVVTGLIGALLALTVVGVRGGRQQQKRTAEDLASLLASAQGRSLGVPEGAAVILDPSGTGGGIFCTNGFDAEMLPLIDASVTGLPPSDPASTTASATVTPLNGDDVNRAYRIIVAARNAAAVAPPTAWLRFQPPGTISFRGAQTSANTVWPRPPAGGPLNALLAQYPAKSSAVAEFDPSTAVDLRFSGVGDDRTQPYGRLDGRGAIAVVFDRAGRVAELMDQVPAPGAAVASAAQQPLVPGTAIYFLIAARSEVAAGANTLASAESVWVALAPQTGRVFVASNEPQSGTDAAALRAARARARRGIEVGK